jgi:hypothetical protein
MEIRRELDSPYSKILTLVIWNQLRVSVALERVGPMDGGTNSAATVGVRQDKTNRRRGKGFVIGHRLG